ncbi:MULTISPECIES: hypothetical protein [unclassified Rhizobium]|uniref:hypothetical protein n=1 Tax=unclassified Rhizobium TaxID=2613769 RepID=UPI0007F09E0A|nr:MULTISPECIES: hypothetical protein [unclassified Rhizobium]ANL12044.1 hypothetical protein AMJ98_PA00098 [Rhizobium sp. N1341]ANM42889.1 hypothetical protein AMK03_PA00098 [Rhizobium sp. N741]
MDMRYADQRIDWIEREIASVERRAGAVTHSGAHRGYKFSLVSLNELDKRFQAAVQEWRADKRDSAKSRAVLLLTKEWHEAINARNPIDYYFPAPKEIAA